LQALHPHRQGAAAIFIAGVGQKIDLGISCSTMNETDV
jgi:hypothetical protein